MRRWRTLAVALAAAALLAAPPLRSRSDASGFASTVTIFESHVHPDLPFDRFTAGRLGIIQPTWDHSFLYFAYRSLAGPGFNPTEQKTMVSLWNDWLGLEPIPPRESDWIANMNLEIVSQKAGLVRVGEAANDWLDARGKVPGVGLIDGIGIYGDAPGMGSFINCGDDAFHTATGTLDAMIAKFGLSSPQVKQWVEAQDQVFDNCSQTLDFGVNNDAWNAMVEEWTNERGKVPGVATWPGASSPCRGMRFRRAALGLETMISNFGASSSQVTQWVDAQDKALTECSNPQPSADGTPTPAPADIPEPLADGAPFERAQRSYQIAAANFYSGDFETAAKMFAAIAADPASPWRQLAPYLVARATIRKATLSAETNDHAILAQAEAQLNKIIAAPGDGTVKRSAQRLLGFVETQLHPEQRQQELAHAVLIRNSEAFQQNVSDYIWMLDHPASYDHYYSDDLTNWIEGLSEFGANCTTGINNCDPVDTIEKWKKTGSMPWLVAAIIETPAADARAPALIEAAEKITPESPAFVTLTYHIARLLIGQGKTEEARKKLDAILATRDQLPVSTVNELMALRMRTARNLNEMLVDAPRTPLGFSDDQDSDEVPANLEATPAPAAETPAPQPTVHMAVAVAGTVHMTEAGHWGEGAGAAATSSGPSTTVHLAVGGTLEEGDSAVANSSGPSMEQQQWVMPTPTASPTPAPTPDPYTQKLRELATGPLFDGDAADVLTRWLPLGMQIEAAHSQILPLRLRGQVARAAFIKAILLGNDTAARGLASQVSDSYPKLRPWIETWLAAKSPDEQSFAAAFMILKNPGLRFEIEPGAGRETSLDEIDSFRDNWWPASTGQESEESNDQSSSGFLTAAEKKSAADEWTKLSAINAPNYLCAAAIEQTKSHPDDARAPEALYRCITAVHLGCSNSQGTDYAQSAFRLLHHRYPDSQWAEKGKVWYKGGSCN